MIKYFTFSVSLKDYFYLFSDAQNRAIINLLRPLLIPPFLNFTAGKSPAYDFENIRLTNRTVGFAGWP